MKITVNDNGPLRIEGDNITITDMTGKSFGLAGRTVVSLCRCGQHAHQGWQSQCPARDLPPPKPRA